MGPCPCYGCLRHGRAFGIGRLLNNGIAAFFFDVSQSFGPIGIGPGKHNTQQVGAIGIGSCFEQNIDRRTRIIDLFFHGKRQGKIKLDKQMVIGRCNIGRSGHNRFFFIRFFYGNGRFFVQHTHHIIIGMGTHVLDNHQRAGKTGRQSGQ